MYFQRPFLLLLLLLLRLDRCRFEASIPAKPASKLRHAKYRQFLRVKVGFRGFEAVDGTNARAN